MGKFIFNLLPFCSRSNFRAINRLETLATQATLQLKNLIVFSFPRLLNHRCKISNRSQRFPSLFALWLHCIGNKHHYTFYNEASIVRKSLSRLLKKVSLLKRFLKRKSVDLHLYTLVSPGIGKVDKHFSYLHRMRQ